MLKITLNEELSRIKEVMGLIKEEDEGTQENLLYNLYGYDIVEDGGKYYAKNKVDKIELPFRDEIQGTIVGRGRNAQLQFDELTLNGVSVGDKMKKWVSSNDAPLQTAGLQGWIAYIVRDGKQVSGMNLIAVNPYPALAAFSISGTLGGDAGYVDIPESKQKEGTIIKFRQSRTKDFFIVLSPCIGGFSTYNKVTPTKPKTPAPTPPIVLTFEKGLNDAFNFNQTILNDMGNKNLQDLIQYAKQNYQGVSANVPVICSASIDGDPNQKLKNGITRAQYDMDLSKRRAEAIANMLTTEVGIPSLKFIPQGIGETDQYDPGKKFPEVTDKNQTAGNRKLIVKLPKLQVTVK